MILTTSMVGISLLELMPENATALFDLVQANTAHLTANGDYAELVLAGIDDIEAELASDPQRHRRFAIRDGEELVGRVDLIGVAPPRHGLGYWLASSHVGRGIATTAVGRVVEFAFADCQATDIFAGVSHGNRRSTELLRRLGFKPVETFETYTRFHRCKC